MGATGLGRWAVVSVGLVVAVTACSTGSGVADRAVRTFDVDGVEVVALTETEDLPATAGRVELWTTVIDEGEGPEAGLGGVNTSLPPQCSGPVLVGLGDAWWSDEAQGVRWGDVRVIVEWSPDLETLDVVDELEGPPGPSTWEDDREAASGRGVPADCADIDRWVPTGAVHDHARSLDEGVRGGVYLLANGEVALQVTDDPASHREALASGDAEACVIQVPWTEDEYRTMAFNLQERLEPLLPMVGVGSEAVAGRFGVWVPVVDRATAEVIAAEMMHPGAVRVIGQAVLLDGP